MKASILVNLLFYFSPFWFGQTIELHSITTKRQLGGDEGYTLDGNKMKESRIKLLNPANFGLNGTYHKKINIIDDYEWSGTLVEITKSPLTDLFFFGCFNSLDGSTEAFTTGEIDSLYKWSKSGGKLIITAGLTGSGYNSTMLNSKWGYSSVSVPIINSVSYITANIANYNYDLFNGAFGNTAGVFQGGAIQGYFNKMPINSVVLGMSKDDKPSLIMDCATLDLLVVDVDVYTSDPGNISKGNSIQGDNDKFWANTIVFMDKLQLPPLLVRDGDNLSVNSSYLDYQWLHNGQPIANATTNLFTPMDDGSYQVEVKVNGGCKIKSDTYYFEPECEVFVPTAFSPDNNQKNDKACVYSPCLKEIDFKLFNRWGEMIFQTTDPTKCWDGTFNGVKANSGVYAWKLEATRKSGSTLTKKGTITLVR